MVVFGVVHDVNGLLWVQRKVSDGFQEVEEHFHLVVALSDGPPERVLSALPVGDSALY